MAGVAGGELLQRLVGGEVGAPDQLGDLLPLLAGAHGEGDPVVVADAPVHALRRHGRVAVGHRRAQLAGALVVEQGLGAERHAALVERHVDPLALAGPVAGGAGRP